MHPLRSVALAALLLHSPPPLAAQQDVRVGVALGSTALVAAVVEVTQDGRSLELSVGTWSFRDLSVSLVGKGYLGASYLRPVLGGGLWAMLSRPSESGRGGVALLVRFPVGFDWRAGGDHFIDFEMSLTRGLYVRRPDPADDRPINPDLLPLPGLSWRWQP